LGRLAGIYTVIVIHELLWQKGLTLVDSHNSPFLLFIPLFFKLS
jgi:hypothetical protein